MAGEKVKALQADEAQCYDNGRDVMQSQCSSSVLDEADLEGPWVCSVMLRR